ncbi:MULTISPECIES: AcaB family transcriptional regulator [unclassified Thioalkalivibrio]|uniref:AcaB family transcriptional regulator n=1 Tax=unclassified Thioalkalivibrio TaxID=2621013 RepID=UPI00036EC9E5|nr:MULTISPECIES: AcaB family transcriptional regulator [unclassified Thioalkalivibrio]
MKPDQGDGYSGTERPTGRPSKYVQEEIFVYTRIGRDLIEGHRPTPLGADGRRQHMLVGLPLYERKARRFWFDAAHDNPYAKLWIQRCRLGVQEAGTVIDGLLDQAEERLGRRGMALKDLPSETPVHQRGVKLKTGLGTQMRDLINDADLLDSACFQLHRMGDISKYERRDLQSRYGRVARLAMRNCLGYRQLRLSAEDVLRDRAVAREAREAMGDLPRAFLTMPGDDAWLNPELAVDRSELCRPINPQKIFLKGAPEPRVCSSVTRAIAMHP